MITRLLFLAQALWLRYEIFETEHYLRDCARDGLIDSFHLRYWRAQLEGMRVRLALLEGRA